MALDRCEPCSCNPQSFGSSELGYRQSMLIILCALLEATEAGGGAASDVNVLTIAAGDTNIGNVDIASAIPAGTNNIGDVDIASALPAGTNNIGDVDIASALPAGTNNIGDVDIASALPAGTNNIGDVDVLTLPALVAGTAAIGSVNIAPTTLGGYSAISLTGLTNAAQAVKSSAQGKFAGLSVYNPNNAIAYIQVFNVATAGAVTVGTTVPTFWIALAPFANAYSISDAGVDMSAGIQVAFTTTPTGNTALGTVLQPTFFYK